MSRVHVERARRRGQRGEQKIIAGKCPHLWFSRKENERFAGNQRHGRQAGGGEGPKGSDTHRRAKTLGVPRADRLAAYLLGGGPETVEKISRDENEVNQNRVARKNDIAAARALRGKKRKGKEQRCVANENIAIDHKHPRDFSTIEKQCDVRPKKIAVHAPHEKNPASPPNPSAANVPAAEPRKPSCKP